jgi:hypothetical protein
MGHDAHNDFGVVEGVPDTQPRAMPVETINGGHQTPTTAQVLQEEDTNISD